MPRLLWIVLSLTWLSAGEAQDSSSAEPRDSSSAYVGLSLGVFDYGDVDGLPISLIDTTRLLRVVGGYRFSDHLALEGSWSKTNDLIPSFEIPLLGKLDIDLAANFEILSMKAVGLLRKNKLDLFAGAGYYVADASPVTGRLAIFGTEVASRDDGATAAAGLQFNFARLSIRGEYEWFDFAGGVAANDLTVGLIYRF